MSSAPSFAAAAAWWCKLGVISFGGPAGQVAIMHRELVDRRKWIDERTFQHALAYCTLLPGPEAQQLATYMGWRMHGVPGGLVAGTMFVLPSFFLLGALAEAYVRWGTVPAVATALSAVQAAVVAVIAHAAWRIGSRAIKGPWLLSIALGALAAARFLPFPAIVLGAALVGLVARKAIVAAVGSGGHGGGAEGGAVAVGGTPRTLPAVLAGVGLVLAGVLVFVALPGPLQTMANFFTRAALVTIGGAYAVLPYVSHAAVETYHWLTPRQVLDGLALGESTPGPLIMLVTFVGYIGGGLPGAAVATFFTFLPSFVFVIAGAPFVERARSLPAFAAPLAAISAAVVAVIADMGLKLGREVLAPEDAPSVFAIVVTVAAFAALVRFKQSVPRVVAVAALVGVARALVAAP
jgi:chromate transporter